jgi:ArsR family transcriptional regulator, arsenate/arsenite/antimonite-responsive transcriptional repressor
MDATVARIALGALAQDTRLALFRLLVEQGPAGLTPGRIADALHVPPATLSFHLKELAHAGLIRARQQSRFIHYSANFHAMNGLVAYLTENCCRASRACGPACAPASVPKQIVRRSRKQATAPRRRTA